MKRTLWLAGLLLIPGLLLQAQTQPVKMVDRIVAQVNDDIITQSEINKARAQIREELASQYAGEQLEMELKRRDVLEELIRKKLMLQKATELGFGSGIELDVSNWIEQLRKENNIKDMEEFERILEQQRGTTLAAFREEVKKEMIIQNLKGYFVDSKITLLTEEIERHYKEHIKDFSSPEEVTLSEIIIPAAPGGQGESLANEYRKRAMQGELFATLASQYSKGPTAGKGGTIGTMEISKLTADIAKVIASVKEGDVSEVVKIPEGYAIFRVDARKPSVARPFDEVKNAIKNRLYQQRYVPELERFIAQLKEDAYIQIFGELGIRK
jgi:peptidyl-prolyl cis-trans isomerase SurA